MRAAGQAPGCETDAAPTPFGTAAAWACAAAAALAACRAGRLEAETFVSLARAAKSMGLQCRREDMTQRYIIKGRGVEAVLCPGFSVARLNGRIAPLSSPARLRRGELEAPAAFVRLLKPMERQQPPRRTAWAGRQPRVVLDPGHGGHDTGAFRSFSMAEKDLVLDVALRAKRILQREGCEVILTRSSDVFIPLEGRVRIANRAAPDVFVSIHANSTPQRRSRANGFETYFVDARSSTMRKGVARLAKRLRPEACGAGSKSDPWLALVLTQTLYDDYCLQSRLLALNIQKGLRRYVRTADRGVKNHVSLHVLRGVMCPRVLVELGFVSNPDTGRRFKQAWYRERLAKGLADGVLSFLRSQRSWKSSPRARFEAKP